MLSMSDLSPQVRVKILGKLSEETKAPLMKLHNCLNGKVSFVSSKLHHQHQIEAEKHTHLLFFLFVCSSQTIEDFLTNIEISAEVCGFMLKKGDKKKER